MAKLTSEVAAADIDLEPAEQELLVEEVQAFARTLGDPASRERYAELGRHVQLGRVPADLTGILEAMLELVLQTQRIRRIYGPEAEKVLSELFFRTRRGAGLRRAAREVNRALEVLRGQQLENLSIVAGPGRHTLVIDSSAGHFTLKLDGAGVRLESVEVAG